MYLNSNHSCRRQNLCRQVQMVMQALPEGVCHTDDPELVEFCRLRENKSYDRLSYE